MLGFMIESLINKCFNAPANNFTMVLNRKEVARKISLK